MRPPRHIAKWVFAVGAVVAAFALGSVHTVTLGVVALLLLAAFANAWWRAPPMRTRRAANIVGVVGIVLTLWTAAQLVPLPASALAVVAPANAEVWSSALSPLQEPGPSWAPVSLDPPATRVQVLRGVVYLLAFGCALRIAARRQGVRFLEWLLVGGSTAMALTAAAHSAVGADEVFGLIRPEARLFSRVAPILNANHLSAYVNIGSCVALAISISRAPKVPRAVPGALFLLTLGTQVWIASRAGVVAAVVGMACVLWLSRERWESRPALVWSRAGFAAAALAVGGFVLAYGERSVRELSSGDVSKLVLIRRASVAALDFVWVGMGRGAFETVFPAYRADGEGNVVFTHAENILVQWASEWGTPVALLAVGALAFALRPASVRDRTSLPAGPAAALVAIFVHNMLDFSLEIPGIAIALAICAACVVGGAANVPSGTRVTWWTRRSRVLVGAATVATIGGLALAGASVGQELHDDQRTLREMAMTGHDGVAFVDQARGAMLRHPADPYLPLLGAVRAARTGDGTALRWLGRSLTRASIYGRAHLLVARQVARRSPSQSRLEYRLAMEQDPALISVAVVEGSRLVRAPDDALELVPEGPFAVRVLEQLALLLRQSQPAAAARVDAELARLAPDSPAVVRRGAEKSLQRLRDGQPPCDRDRPVCIDQAIADSARLVAVAPRECRSHALHAEVRAASGDERSALDGLEAASQEVDDRDVCLSQLVEMAAAAGDEERVTRVLDRFVRVACTSDRRCVDVHLHVAAVEERRRHFHAAHGHARRALEYAPGRNDVLARVAALASAAGMHHEALAAYERLASREPGNAAWSAALAQERARLGKVRP